MFKNFLCMLGFHRYKYSPDVVEEQWIRIYNQVDRQHKYKRYSQEGMCEVCGRKKRIYL